MQREGRLRRERVRHVHLQPRDVRGCLDEAARLVQVARDGARPTSRLAQAEWRSVDATILAARGLFDAAVELAHEAARLLRATDLLSLRADVYVDLATALQARGDSEESARAAEQARMLYERKGNIVAARRIREAARLVAARE